MQSIATANITQMYVEFGYRGHNIGVSLLSLAKQYASTPFNIDTLELAVYPQNQSAIRTYEKSGFKITESMLNLNGNELCMVFDL